MLTYMQDATTLMHTHKKRNANNEAHCLQRVKTQEYLVRGHADMQGGERGCRWDCRYEWGCGCGCRGERHIYNDRPACRRQRPDKKTRHKNRCTTRRDLSPKPREKHHTTRPDRCRQDQTDAPQERDRSAGGEIRAYGPASRPASGCLSRSHVQLPQLQCRGRKGRMHKSAEVKRAWIPVAILRPNAPPVPTLVLAPTCRTQGGDWRHRPSLCHSNAGVATVSRVVHSLCRLAHEARGCGT